MAKGNNLQNVGINIHDQHLNIRCTRALGLSQATCKWVHEYGFHSYTPRWAEDGDGMDDAMFDINDLNGLANKKGEHVLPVDKNIVLEIGRLATMCAAAGIDYVQVNEPNEDEDEDEDED